MFRNQVETIQEWLKSRSPRESFFVFLIGFIVIYALWDFLLYRPLQRQKATMEAKIQLLHTQTETLKKEATMIIDLAEKYSYLEKMEEKNKLITKEKNLKEQLGSVVNLVVSKEGLSQLTNQILAIQPGIQLVSLKKLDMIPWVGKTNEKAEIVLKYGNIYKQSFEIKFHSDYFNTLSYLSKLEKLPWRLYWDGLEYKVSEYPNADVTFNFYILINQES